MQVFDDVKSHYLLPPNVVYCVCLNPNALCRFLGLGLILYFNEFKALYYKKTIITKEVDQETKI